jgi:WD40 repeat protein
LTASIGGKTSISGDGVDISQDNNYVVTGGGTLGEGVKTWDMRRLGNPLREFNWSTVDNGDVLNPIVNCVKFVPNQNLILAGVSDDTVSAKCFNTLSGTEVENFNRVAGNCFSMDVSNNGEMAIFGDSEGALHMDNLNYTF